MKEPTEKQAEVLFAILMKPTVSFRELAEMFRITTPGVQDKINWLRHQGYIEPQKKFRSHRTLTLSAKGKEYAQDLARGTNKKMYRRVELT